MSSSLPFNTPPYRRGSQALYFAWSALTRTCHVRLVEVQSCEPEGDRWKVTISVRWFDEAEDRKHPGATVVEVANRPPIMVDDHGVGRGLMPATVDLLRAMRSPELPIVVQAQLAAAFVGGDLADRELWTLSETAAYLRIPEQSLYRQNKDKTAPRRVRIGRYILYPAVWVRQYVLEREVCDEDRERMTRRAKSNNQRPPKGGDVARIEGPLPPEGFGLG